MAKTRLGDPSMAEYALVADRITLFYDRYPAGRIVTRLHSRSEKEITFLAQVFRGPDDVRPAATGWASEREGDGEVNLVACLENTETSAIGRALANLGFTASVRRPSREEMEKVARERVRVATRAVAVTPPTPLRVPLAVPLPVAPPAPARAETTDTDPLQRRANAVHDVLSLIERAEAIGFSEHRAATLRTALERPNLTPRVLTRLERRLRGWMVRHRPHGR